MLANIKKKLEQKLENRKNSVTSSWIFVLRKSKNFIWIKKSGFWFACMYLQVKGG
jgi:hypothetical protein